MADMSLSDYLAIADRDDDEKGEFNWFWIILIFLFFLAFSGGGLFGNKNYGSNGLDQTQRDILTSSCNTQKEVLQSNYNTLLGFKDQQMQIAQCCLTRIFNWLKFAGNHKRNLMLGVS